VSLDARLISEDTLCRQRIFFNGYAVCCFINHDLTTTFSLSISTHVATVDALDTLCLSVHAPHHGSCIPLTALALCRPLRGCLLSRFTPHCVHDVHAVLRHWLAPWPVTPCAAEARSPDTACPPPSSACNVSVRLSWSRAMRSQSQSREARDEQVRSRSLMGARAMLTAQGLCRDSCAPCVACSRTWSPVLGRANACGDLDAGGLALGPRTGTSSSSVRWQDSPRGHWQTLAQHPGTGVMATRLYRISRASSRASRRSIGHPLLVDECACTPPK
jgi:hypothetical protein